MAYRVRVDRSLCIGSADCVRIAAQTFALDAENKSTVKKQGADPDATLLEAAKACPVAAIVIEDENGTQIYP